MSAAGGGGGGATTAATNRVPFADASAGILLSDGMNGCFRFHHPPYLSAWWSHCYNQYHCCPCYDAVCRYDRHSIILIPLQWLDSIIISDCYCEMTMWSDGHEDVYDALHLHVRF